MLTTFLVIALSRFRKIRAFFGIKKEPIKIRHTRAARILLIKRRQYLARNRRLKQGTAMAAKAF